MESTTGYTFYPLCGTFCFPWHRHQIEGTNGFYCLIRKTERFTIPNVESQVFTPNNSRLDPGSNPGCPRDKRMSYHWTNCARCFHYVCYKYKLNYSDTTCRVLIVMRYLHCSDVALVQIGTNTMRQQEWAERTRETCAREIRPLPMRDVWERLQSSCALSRSPCHAHRCQAKHMHRVPKTVHVQGKSEEARATFSSKRSYVVVVCLCVTLGGVWSSIGSILVDI